MIPGSEVNGITPTNNLPSTSLSTLTQQLKQEGFITETDLLQSNKTTENNIKRYVDETSQPAKFVPPPIWSDIPLDKKSIIDKPYTSWVNPITGITKPKMTISTGMTLGTESTGVIPSILNRFRGGQVDLSDIESRIDTLESQTVKPQNLDNIKTGISDLFDMNDTLINDPTFGLKNTFNRLDQNVQTNNNYCNSLTNELDRIIDRTESLRNNQDSIARELEGVRIIAGTGTPIETVKSEADRISRANSTSIVDKALSDLLSDKLYVNSSTDWFGRKLSTYDIATQSSLSGFPSIKGIFTSGSSIDQNKIDSTKRLISFENQILDGSSKGINSYNTLFQDTFSYNGSSFTGLKSFVENLPGLLPTGGVGGTSVVSLRTQLNAMGIPIGTDNKLDYSSFGTELVKYEPFLSLKDFFFKVKTEANNFEGYYDKLYKEYEKLTNIFGTLKYYMFEKEFKFAWNHEIRIDKPYDPTFVSFKGTGGQVTHTGLLGMFYDVVDDIIKSYDKVYSGYIDQDNADTFIKEIKKNIQSLGDYVKEKWKEAFRQFLPSYNLNLTSFENTTFFNPDFGIVPDAPSFTSWDTPFNDALKGMGSSIDSLPKKTPTGWS